MKRTWLMKEVEDQFGKPIEYLLADWRYGDDALTAEDIGIRMGIATSTVSRWMKLSGLTYRQLAIRYMAELRKGELRIVE